MTVGSIPPFDPYVLPFSSRAPEVWRAKAETDDRFGDETAEIVREQDRRMHEAQQQALTYEKALQDGRAATAADRLSAVDELLKSYVIIVGIAAGRNDPGAVEYLARRAEAFLAGTSDDVEDVRIAAERSSNPQSALNDLRRTVQSVVTQVRALAATAERATGSGDAGRALQDIARALEDALGPAEPAAAKRADGVDLKV